MSGRTANSVPQSWGILGDLGVVHDPTDFRTAEEIIQAGQVIPLEEAQKPTEPVTRIVRLPAQVLGEPNFQC